MTINYSVVIPIKNEENNIIPLIKEISPVMDSLSANWELIYIDDGSTDNSLNILKKQKKIYPFLRIIVLEKNYGQSSAFDAGFKKANGDIIITLDGDLQNDPHDIPLLLDHLKEFDLVCGWRKKRNDPLIKKLTSRIANAIRSKTCKDGMHDTGCSLKAFYREKFNEINFFHGMHRFLPALFKIEGFNISQIEVSHRKRAQGKSKYSFSNRFLGPIIDMLAVFWLRKRHLKYKIKEEV